MYREDEYLLLSGIQHFVFCRRQWALINKNQVDEKDFEQREDGAFFLNESGRKSFIAAWQKRKDEELKHPLWDVD